ncbi:MAG: helix-turn-helix domain-containing protein [Rhodospirillales bacterium]|nr:helix-turn-helix domain-containing protein [Rhodospirillales bacterium]
MLNILRLIEAFIFEQEDPGIKSPVKNLGFISCTNAVHIRHVPFYDPCIILVLAGRKAIFDRGAPIVCDAGCALAVPAPASFDLKNEPDARSGKYRALVIPFKYETLDRLRKAHAIDFDHTERNAPVLRFEHNETLLASIENYLASANDPNIVVHRLMEILLILANQNRRLLSYTMSGESWGQRVRAVLATDLTRAWDIGDVCKRLATTESTLRRNLKKEDTGFRELAAELRLTSALMKLLQTSQPVYQIAYDCGFQSVSRFTSNFHKRFGLPPRDLRVSLTGVAPRPAAVEVVSGDI